MSVQPNITVACRNAGHRFGHRTLFAGLELTLGAGDVVAVLGPNGTGKSTLLKLIAGLLTPTWGRVEVQVDGQPLSAAGRRAAVGYCSPDLMPYRPLTVRENLAFFAKVRGLAPGAVEAASARLALDDRLDQAVAELSSGYVQRVRLALAVLHEPPVLLLDEPGSNLDDAGHAQVAQVIAWQRTRGLCLVAANDPRDIAYGNRKLQLAR